MNGYIDGSFAAYDGALLSYSGVDVSLKLPRRLGQMFICNIGDGAVMESNALQQVVVPKGVDRIGKLAFGRCEKLMNVYIPYSVSSIAKDAFQGCKRLTNLYVYGLELNEQRYKELLSSSIRVNGTQYLSRSFPDFPRVRDAVGSTDVKPANLVQSGITRLFTSQSLEEEKGAASLQRNLDGFSFNSSEQYMTETSEFFRLIGDNSVYEIDFLSEKRNEEFLKTEKTLPIMKTAVFTFDDGKTVIEKDNYILTVHIKIGYHFWQSKLPVRYSGTTYYIYRRNYLSSEPNLNYISRDVAVFTSKGPVTDKREALEVYAKYKLLSIL